MKRHLFALLLTCAVLPAMAAESPAPLPVVVADSELFEIVGRLDAVGLVMHVDTAAENSPVLDARLSLELDGREIQAVFRPAEGDYLVADADWLTPLRQPGEHLLSFTLLAGDEADLLSGELVVDAPVPTPVAGWRLSPWLGGGLLAVFGLIGSVWFYRRRRGAQA